MGATQPSCSRSSSREVRIRVPTFSVVYFSRGTPQKKNKSVQGHLAGGSGGSSSVSARLLPLAGDHDDGALPRRESPS